MTVLLSEGNDREDRLVTVSDAPEMLPAERRARIMEALQEQRVVKVSTLSEVLGVSEITIRRDLKLLDREGVLRRTHGGALLTRRAAAEPQLEAAVAAETCTDERARIARAAAAMIEPKDTVFLGSGTTVAAMLRFVDPALEARVVTHSLAAAAEAQSSVLELIFLGGLFRPSINAVEGSWTIDMIGSFNADKAFIGADGLDVTAGLTTPSMAVAGIELAMIRRTRGEVVVLADSNKLGLVHQVVVCPLDQIDLVLVDDGASQDVRARIQRAGPQCEAV
jgi:DeoR/GlpR family transcriptional regulator of sugar metabolism